MSGGLGILNAFLKDSFFNILFIYEREREREREAETQAEGEAGSMHREPDMGLNLRTPGSGPGLKAVLNH